MFVESDIRRASLLALIGLLLGTASCGDGQPRQSADPAAAQTTSDSTISATSEQQGSVTGAGDAERPVDAETLPYAEVDEELVYGHFAFPSDMIEPLPAIIVVHDWWGLNDDTRNAASRLAAQGYMVLAVDLYGGETVDRLQAARAKMISVVENPDVVESNLRQALDFVGVAGAPKKATLGWGFGGSWALNSTMLFPRQIDAAVVFYGQVSNDEEKLRAVDAPILGLFGARDRGIKIETVREFEAAMQRLRKPLTLEVYQNAGHAFADPARNNYIADVAEDAWQKTIDFLSANLASEDES